MRIFKTQQDFVTLRRTGAFPMTILDQVEGYSITSMSYSVEKAADHFGWMPLYLNFD
ncbi:hypothetical protein [Paenibacillus nasutitermitis]|uniref:Uncharacterized protein n=1 Tax=Paenibacillus nasutitermitis TaxID=1652958 RepID=A0A917E273_9BACL|nr:hypothetical protein [Paenibacillus nasutitermitis]GGD95500.1 hypothetical protein GCM10010911_62720 [Paenibacillus nasutitermitis]